MDRVGLPLFPALKKVDDILTEHDVLNRLKIIASSKLVGRGFMLSIGFNQAMQCGSNTCPIGITTRDPELERSLDIYLKSTRVAHYVDNLEHDL